MEQPIALNELASDPELLLDFITESREHLAGVEMQLLALDQDAANVEALHSIFRGFHTIKGLSGFLGLEAIGHVTHEVETVLDLARTGKISMTPAHIDVVLASKDYVHSWLRQLEAMASGKTPVFPENQDLLKSVRALASGAADPVPSAPDVDPVPATLSALASTQPVSAPVEAQPESQSNSGETRSIKVDTQKLDFLVDMVGEMVIAQSLVKHDPDLAIALKPKLTRNLAQLARITGEVQRTAMAMRMVPIRQLFNKMSRVVRDLTRKNGKQVELELMGEETELDRSIVEELADPLMHMVRNALDHGVGTPEERVRAGKNPVARVTLKAGHQAGYILVHVSDDGRGLDTEKILRKAREKGMIEEGAKLQESEIFNLIFAPGFSTAEQITEVSGRGVGMDVVRRQMEKLRGKIEVSSIQGQGTTVLLKLPLTLAIIDGLLVRAGGETYIVPLFAVREMLRPTADMLSTVENRDEMVLVRGSLLPVVRLNRRFGLQAKSEDLCASLLIVTESGGKRFGLVVDELIGKQEVVIKSLVGAVRNIRGIAGGAILGDGRVGLILDPEGLFAA
jgi:two-component system, chemotaxis family, sensor kinase CheA